MAEPAGAGPGASPPDRLLVVVPCLDEAAHLPALLPRLLAGVREGDLVVVADGGSTDGSRAIVAALARDHPALRLLPNPARRQSAGVNLAVRRFGAEARWLLRVDAHCGYPDDYAATLLAAARRERAGSVVVPLVTAGAGCFQRAVAAAQNSKLGTGGSAHRHRGAGRLVDHGHHALMDIAAYRAAGGYDEAWTHNEDAELDRRLGAAGVRLWLEPAAAITYYPRRAPGPLWRQYLGYGGGRARTLARHGGRPKLRQALPLAVAPAVLLAAVGVAATAAAGRWALVLSLPALGWAGLCLSYGALLGLRARDGCAAMAGAAAMVMHAAWSTGYWRQVLSRRRLPDPPAAF